MSGLAILCIILGYMTLGTISAGAFTRLMRGDSSLCGIAFFFWPITTVALLLIALYALVAGKTTYEIIR